MNKLPLREVATASAYGLLGWAVSAAAASVALWKTPAPEAALSAHAVVVPVAFLLVAFVYFRRAQPLRPVATGLLFAALVLAMDSVVSFAFGRAVDARSLLLGTALPAYSALLATGSAGLASSFTWEPHGRR